MSASSCPKTHKDYKLPITKAKQKSSDWNFFTKVGASSWDFESFQLHHKSTSSKTAKFNTIKINYNNILDTMISNNLVPNELLPYINGLKVSKKRKLNAVPSPKPQPPPTVTSKGTVVINNINNGQEQTNNHIQVDKRRKLRPSITRMKTTEQERDNTMESEEEGERNVTESEEEDDSSNLDDSFDSVNNHPNATHYYDYFKGNGQKEWNTTEGFPNTEDDDIGISKIARDYREESIKAAKRLENISDCRVLSLSFVYPFCTYIMDYSFTQSIRRHHLLVRSFVKPFVITPIPNDAVLWCHRLDSSAGDKFNAEIKNMKRAIVDMESESAVTTLNIAERITKEIRYWSHDGTEDDFMSYIYYFTDEVFSYAKSPELVIHKSLKHLTTDTALKPDLKVSYDYKKGIGFDVFIVEVKKNNNAHTPNKSDFIKLNLEMKLMLDKLIKINVDDPVVYGLLVKGFECFLFRMTLEHDGFYFNPIVCRFHLPRDVSDLMLVPKATSIFLQLKQELGELVKRIQNKQKGKSHFLALTRPSYDMPVLIKDPLQHLLNND